MSKRLSLLLALPGLTLAGLQINQIGYDALGSKLAVLRSESGSYTASSFVLKDSTGKVVLNGTPKSEGTVPGWGNARHWTLDFSRLRTSGRYLLTVLPDDVSDTVRIGNDLLYRSTAVPMVDYFRAMRNTDENHRSVPVFGQPSRKRNVYGGWMDASGDQGKYLSHQSVANFMNPQQIPLVDWVLLKSFELDSIGLAGQRTAFRSEAAWGADFLLRMLDRDSSFFYMNVFNVWGKEGEPWELCSWYSSKGTKSSDYQSAWREGGGMAIAALARAGRMQVEGDSAPAQYVAGAERAWKTLVLNGDKWADDHKQNLIDDYCALLAAVELHRATSKPTYLAAAKERAARILKRQQPDGWFAADDSTRPFYSAVDEGLPVVALLEFLDIAPESFSEVAPAIRRNLDWYRSLSYEVANPYRYARLYRPTIAAVSPSGAVNYAAGKPSFASASEGSYLPKNAVDGQITSRWGSSPLGDSTAWLRVDLGDTIQLDSVQIDWETAYAKTFRLVTSLDSAGHGDSLTLQPSGSGWQSIPLTGKKVRWIRIQAVQLLQKYYGMSLYELQAYGRPVVSSVPTSPGKSAFFMPHANETGYWWQGENARLGSMSAAFYLAGRKLIHQWDPSTDSLGQLAQGQLDWVAGRNPAGVSFISGFGRTNSPDYMSHPNVPGGICNGITSDTASEQLPVFNPPVPNGWENWRWVEQWIPHSAWWLMGVSAGRWAQNTVPLDTAAIAIHPRSVVGPKAHLMARNGSWILESNGSVRSVRALDATGSTRWIRVPEADPEHMVLPAGKGMLFLQIRHRDGSLQTLPAPGI